MTGNYLVYILHVGVEKAEILLSDEKTARKLFEKYANDTGGVDMVWIGKVVKQYWGGKETRKKAFKAYCEAQRRLWGGEYVEEDDE